MNVLLVNPASPHSFWTFDQSLKLLGKKTLLPPLGLITVAALLPEDWELRLVDRSFQKISEEDWRWAEMLMVTGMVVHREDMLRVVGEAKAKGKTVVVGGPYATSLPEELVGAGADLVVQGEAESSLGPFLTALAQGKRGVIPSQGRPDMSVSPTPRFDLLQSQSYVTLSIQTSRGCPFDCEFCDIVNLYGRRPRYKNPDQVMAELEAIFSLGWRGDVLISDDNFIGNRKHARAILDRLTPWMESHGKPFGFWTQTSVDLGRNKDLIDRMTAANFSTVFVGIESPDDNVLKLNRKFQNVRNPLEEALHAICANGLSVVGSFIIGFDGETKGVDDRIMDLVERTNMHGVMLNLLQAPPNTALWDRLKRENRLLDGRTDGQSTGGSRLNFIPSRPESEIIQEYVNLTERLYEPSSYLTRAYNYYLTMRPTRKALALKAGMEPPKEPPKAKRPLWRKLKEFRGFLILLWRNGIAASHRRQFWRQLVGIYRKNPSRIKGYVLAVGLGENLFALRRIVRKRAEGRE